jgi:hypothetical protein
LSLVYNLITIFLAVSAPCLPHYLQACPEQQLCRLLSKLTKGCTPGSQDLAALAANAHLVAVLVRCCSPADRKTCKRALQVGCGVRYSRLMLATAGLHMLDDCMILMACFFEQQCVQLDLFNTWCKPPGSVRCV